METISISCKSGLEGYLIKNPKCTIELQAELQEAIDDLSKAVAKVESVRAKLLEDVIKESDSQARMTEVLEMIYKGLA